MYTKVYQTRIPNKRAFRNLQMKSLLMSQAHLLIHVQNGWFWPTYLSQPLDSMEKEQIKHDWHTINILPTHTSNSGHTVICKICNLWNENVTMICIIEIYNLQNGNMLMICKIEICNLRNGNMLMICKIEICDLWNGNMLMICKIEICNLWNGNMLMICK